MGQAVAEATDESSRTAPFVWRTRQILAGQGLSDREPSRATTPVNGSFVLPQGPAFGISLDDARIAEREVLTAG